MKALNGAGFKYCFATIFILSTVYTNTFAQETTSKFHGGIWLGYQLRKAINDKFSWNSDLQVRFRNNSAFYDYTLVRSGVQYDAGKKVSVAAGLLYGTDNIHDKKLPVWKNEYRIWEDVKYTIGAIKKIQFFQQFRFEQRFFDLDEENKKDASLFALRYRYRAELRKALNKHWKIYAANELMYQTEKNKTYFQQDRISIGTGYNLNEKNEIQLALMQVAWKAPDLSVVRINYLQQL